MKSYMKFKVEEEVSWNADTMKPETKYFIWAGQKCVKLVRTKEEALEALEAISNNYPSNIGTTVIAEKEVEYEL
jgi:hypothetical protein